DEYNDVFVNMMKEVVANYGPLFEFWWDGANGEGPNGKKQVYDWRRFEQTLRTIAPNTPIFSDIGPDMRWAGNEKGIAGKTNWNLLDTAGFTRGEGSPHVDTLNKGNENGNNWIPAECDVSIRPGWFYHEEEDDKVKSPEQLVDLYLKSVGRGANLLLNVPPDRRGLINEHDSIALIGFKELREKSFRKNFAKNAKGYYLLYNNKKSANKLNDDKNNTYESIALQGLSSVSITFEKPEKINCIVLKEYLNDGQKCKKFRLLIMNDKHEALKEINGTTIGKSRIITFPSINAETIVLKVEEQKAPTGISEIQAYLIDEHLVEKD
nr:alpha-L-fucosidase [Chitinophagaceae bacterium]